ncbi:potassium transporter [beta proteobacterium AAP121]|nr:potassium transporter [beta proteobacterium AAP65]KPG00458.1 potassium transporter [beta proteobacterium AAP121]
MDLPSWLHATVVYLGAAVLAVPLARLLGLGSIIGYLAAGVVIGPWGLKAVTDPATILQFAEFGVVLMLFLVGLELEPKRLWSLRRPIFGWGSVQLFGSTALVGAVAVAAGLPPLLALVAGLALAQSSTAIALGTVAERNLMPTSGGRSILSVSLFQDIGGIAILTLLPMLAVREGSSGGPWLGLAQGLSMVLAIVFGGRLLVRPALRWIARSGSPEIFTAASLLLVVSTAALMHAVGLSMALGAFLAGVLLAESEYRRQLETDLEPFKGLLLGLFFIAVGMSIDFAVVLAQPMLMAAVVAGFVLLKGLLLVVMARLMGLPLGERPVFVVMLAQGGEFGFVVLQTAGSAGLVAAGPSSFLLAAIALSMLMTPLLMLLVDRVIAPRLAARGSGPALDEIAEDQAAPLLILGFGRYGQVVGRLLNANGLSATVLDHDAEQVATVRRFGWPAFYGDATRLDLLRIAGAGQARVVVVAIDDIEQSLAVVDLLREHFPQATLVARARNATHWYGLHERGVQHIERETFDAALLSGRTVLELMGWQPHSARQQALRFKQHTLALMEQMAPHQGDEKELIALAKQGRQQLEELWAQERADRETQRQRRNAGFSAQHLEGDD